MRSPLNKPYSVTSPYGKRILGGLPDFHNGIDLVPRDGKHPTELFATADGIVADTRNTVADSHTGLGVKTMVTGNYVNIRTASGCVIIYRHLKYGSVPAAIKIDQPIKAGALIGVMGSTGQSSATHLHYEIRDPHNQSFDPAPYLGNDAPLPEMPATAPPVHYDVRVNDGAALNVRGGAGTNFPATSFLKDSPTVTIVGESDGEGAKKWGRLQDGRGWIALDFTTRIKPPPAATDLKPGSRVRVNRGAKTYSGGAIASFVYDNTYTLDFLSGDRAVLDSKGLCTAFNANDLTVA